MTTTRLFQPLFAGLCAVAVLGGCATRAPLAGRAETANEAPVVNRGLAGDGPPPLHGGFDWPVDKARLTRGFLPNKRRPHLGLDLAAPKGTPILASKGGTVIYQGKAFHGFGKMVLIESGGGWAALYAHLDKIFVKEGQKLEQGQLLGQMGRTGRATGVHLHFEIRKDRGPVDPLPLLPAGRELAERIRGKHHQLLDIFDEANDPASEEMIKAAMDRSFSEKAAMDRGASEKAAMDRGRDEKSEKIQR